MNYGGAGEGRSTTTTSSFVKTVLIVICKTAIASSNGPLVLANQKWIFFLIHNILKTPLCLNLS